MLTHPGTPCVFWDHYAAPGLGDTVRALMKLRRAHGINARSTVTIVKGTANLYAATVDGKIAMKIGGGDWSPGSAGVDVGQKAWELELSGPNFAVWRAVFK